jgi:hypothetical protein
MRRIGRVLRRRTGFDACRCLGYSGYATLNPEHLARVADVDDTFGGHGMSGIAQVAWSFYEACEAGKGWEVCSAYCKPDASFSAQAEPLADTRSLQAYTGWMKGLIGFMPDAAMSFSRSRPTTKGKTSVLMPRFFLRRTPGKAVRARPPAKAPRRTMSMYSRAAKSGI